MGRVGPLELRPWEEGGKVVRCLKGVNLKPTAAGTCFFAVRNCVASAGHLASLRMPALGGLVAPGPGSAKPDAEPVVVLVQGDPAAEGGLREYAWRHGGPALWFAMGYAILVQRPGSGELTKAHAEAARARLRAHPICEEGGNRWADLFSQRKVDGDPSGYPTIDPCQLGESPRRAELVFAVPTTYQRADGTSDLIPHDVRWDTVKWVLLRLTGTPGGAYGAESGYTTWRGGGWWFHDRRREPVDEGVDLVSIHAPVSAAMAWSTVRYLRWAWLQEEVFATLDGRRVEE